MTDGIMTGEWTGAERDHSSGSARTGGQHFQFATSEGFEREVKLIPNANKIAAVISSARVLRVRNSSQWAMERRLRAYGSVLGT